VRLRAHLRAFGAAVLNDVRASLAAPVVERLRADLAAERAKSTDLAQRCTEREGRLGAAYADLCEETKRADRAEIELNAARANAALAEGMRKAALTEADELSAAFLGLARHVGAPHATVEHIAHAFDARIGDLYARLIHAQEIANVALAEGLKECEALRAQEQDLRALQDRTVRELRGELARANTRYAEEADRRVKTEEVLHKLREATKHHEPALLAARHYLIEGSASAREELRAALDAAGYPCRARVTAEAPPKAAT